MTKRRGTRVEGGRFYGRVTAAGPLLPAPAGTPDAWICRRADDFPYGGIPGGAGFADCAECGASIVYNPARVPTVPPDTPKVCMQCARIEPLPIVAPS